MKNIILSAFITIAIIALFFLINFKLSGDIKFQSEQEKEILRSQITNLKGEIANLQANFQNLSSENGTLKTIVENAKNCDNKIENLNKEIWDLQTENRNLKLENITLKEKLNLSTKDSKFESKNLRIEIE